MTTDLADTDCDSPRTAGSMTATSGSPHPGTVQTFPAGLEVASLGVHPSVGSTPAIRCKLPVMSFARNTLASTQDDVDS